MPPYLFTVVLFTVPLLVINILLPEITALGATTAEPFDMFSKVIFLPKEKLVKIPPALNVNAAALPPE